MFRIRFRGQTCAICPSHQRGFQKSNDVISMGIFINRIFKDYSQIVKITEGKNGTVLYLVSDNTHPCAFSDRPVAGETPCRARAAHVSSVVRLSAQG